MAYSESNFLVSVIFYSLSNAPQKAKTEKKIFKKTAPIKQGEKEYP